MAKVQIMPLKCHETLVGYKVIKINAQSFDVNDNVAVLNIDLCEIDRDVKFVKSIAACVVKEFGGLNVASAEFTLVNSVLVSGIASVANTGDRGLSVMADQTLPLEVNCAIAGGASWADVTSGEVRFIIEYYKFPNM